VRRFYRPRKDKVTPDPAYALAQAYDDWLLGYTNAILRAYKPEPIGAHLTVFRSAGEPSGPFLDPKLGWEGMASKGVDLVVVPGDHYSVFEEPGVSFMAKCIEAAMGPMPVKTDAQPEDLKLMTQS
jgi:thioesterase domain-containing protein